MASANPRRRASAAAEVRKTVKASILVDVDLHARWSAAASLRGMDRGAFAVEALRVALKGIVITDRSKPKLADGSAQADDADVAA